MPRQHGITANTHKRFFIDAGAVYKNYGEAGQALIGATRDGNTFTIETEYRDMPVDGAKGSVKGGRRITTVTATITANFIEVTTDILKLAMPGAVATDFPAVTPTHDQITRALQITLADYMTNVALVGQISGTTEPIIIGIKNVIADGNLEIAATDNEEAVVAVQFKAHSDPADLDSEPWFIRRPKEV